MDWIKVMIVEFWVSLGKPRELAYHNTGVGGFRE